MDSESALIGEEAKKITDAVIFQKRGKYLKDLYGSILKENSLLTQEFANINNSR